MIKGIESILLSSGDSGKLADFYKDKVGLKCTAEMEMGEDEAKGYEFDLGSGSILYINQHSEVQGQNPNPERYMLNFEVDDIEKEAKRLKDEGVEQFADVYHVEGYGLISTFKDIDGNFFQLVQVKASE